MALRPAPFDVVEASRRLWLDRWDESAASGNAVFTAVLRAHQMLMHQVDEVVKANGTTFGRYQVLAWVVDAPGDTSLSWISEVLRVPPATVTNLIDRLQADGLLERVPHPTDARTTLAEATEAGRSLVATISAQLNESVYQPLGLGARERAQLVGLLERLRRNGGEFDAERSDEQLSRLDSSRPTAAPASPNRRS